MAKTGGTRATDGVGLSLGVVLLAAAVLGASPVSSGCGRSREARGETAGDLTSGATSLAPGEKFSEAAFELVIRPTGEYRAGQLGRVEAVLTARDPYHVNAEFPLKFKVKPGAGVKYARDVVGREAVKFEAKRATVPVEFTPDGQGRRVVGGTFRFSVCNDQRCLVENRELQVAVDVK